jgi:hypothetical protein
MKKAQLILFGGRASIPNMLTITHQKPDVIVAISSKESCIDLPKLEKSLKVVLPNCELRTPEPVDGFDFRQIEEICKSELMKYPDADWIFNITSATTIMSIAAYEVAKSNANTVSIHCVYVDTSHSRLVSLVGDVFSITVKAYIAAYYYKTEHGTFKNYRDHYRQEAWVCFAEQLGKSLDKVAILKQVIAEFKGYAPKKSDDDTITHDYIVKKFDAYDANQVYNLLEEAQQLNILSGLQKNDSSSLSLKLSERQYKFFNGAWLELYVWNEAKKLNIFDDCEWDLEIIDSEITKSSGEVFPHKELDVVMTYRAQLIFAECKTGSQAYDTHTLDDITTKAELIGGRFVTRLLVTNVSKSARQGHNEEGITEDFLKKARQRNIRVVAADELPNIGEILEQEAKNSIRI